MAKKITGILFAISSCPKIEEINSVNSKMFVPFVELPHLPKMHSMQCIDWIRFFVPPLN